MTNVGITGFGGYIPRLRLSRASVVKANSWVDPGLAVYGKSERSMRNVDEDSVTMAVEAARNCLNGDHGPTVNALYFASTTMPFADRQNSTIVAEALSLGEELATLDITSSQRAGTSGLLAALKGVQNGGSILFVASDCRRTKSAEVKELLYGDGAAALTLGGNRVLAEFLGGYSINKDFVDHFRGEGSRYDHYFEERWIRDEAYFKFVPQALEGLFLKTGISAKEVDHFILPCLIRRVRETLAGKLGLRAETVCDDLSAGCGETGTAHPILMLAHTLEEAAPGQKILVVGFGQGVDALVFQATDRIRDFSPKKGVKACLAEGVIEESYQKFLSFRDMVEIDWGMRSDTGSKTRPSAAWRTHKHFNGLIGGRCTECGTIQFPIARICVNPDCRGRDSMVDYRLAESPAKVASFTADRLAFSPNPPLFFGMIQFEEGAKMMMNFTECDIETMDVGVPMKMVYRILQMDKVRNLRTYFWKAAPIADAGREG